MLTDYAVTQILDYYFGSVDSLPTSWYLGLSTTTINADGTGITEPSGVDGYARVEIPNDKTNWTSESGGSLENSLSIYTPESLDAWGIITDAFLSDSLSGGNPWWFDALDSSVNVSASGRIVVFHSGDIIISLANP